MIMKYNEEDCVVDVDNLEMLMMMMMMMMIVIVIL
jgi:hypothetical protein